VLRLEHQHEVERCRRCRGACHSENRTLTEGVRSGDSRGSRQQGRCRRNTDPGAHARGGRRVPTRGPCSRRSADQEVGRSPADRNRRCTATHRGWRLPRSGRSAGRWPLLERNNSTGDDVVCRTSRSRRQASRMPVECRQGARHEATMNRMVAASRVGINHTPNQPHYSVVGGGDPAHELTPRQKPPEPLLERGWFIGTGG